MTIKHALMATAGALALAGAFPCDAQPFPSRTIELIVPYPAGNSMDIVARLLQAPLSKALGQPVVVVNQGGASGVIGSSRVSRSPADGHTLLVNDVSALVVPGTKADAPYDAIKGFTPIAAIAAAPYMLVANAGLPIRDVGELVQAAKAKPGTINYGSSGIGSPNHMSGELMKSISGIDIVHVPYSGSAASIADTIAGRTQVAFASPAAALPGIQSGSLRPLGVTSTMRWPRMPDVPTIAEQGVAGFENNYLVAVFAPPGLSDALVKQLTAAIREALKDPVLAERYKSMGYGVPETMPPEQFRALVRGQSDKWAKLIKSANIQVE
jgi:tripartite-type tricarboxylate transporter receptor subunit TctC